MPRPPVCAVLVAAQAARGRKGAGVKVSAGGPGNKKEKVRSGRDPSARSRSAGSTDSLDVEEE